MLSNKLYISFFVIKGPIIFNLFSSQYACNICKWPYELNTVIIVSYFKDFLISN